MPSGSIDVAREAVEGFSNPQAPYPSWRALFVFGRPMVPAFLSQRLADRSITPQTPRFLEQRDKYSMRAFSPRPDVW